MATPPKRPKKLTFTFVVTLNRRWRLRFYRLSDGTIAAKLEPHYEGLTFLHLADGRNDSTRIVA